MEKAHFTLTAEQEAHLTDLTSRGTTTVKAYRRATALLLHQGHSYSAVARQLGVRYATVSDWANAFTDTGLQMLQDKPRSGRPLTPRAGRAHGPGLLACPGRAQPVALRLLAGKAVALGHCGQMLASSTHSILKKTSYGLS